MEENNASLSEMILFLCQFMMYIYINMYILYILMDREFEVKALISSETASTHILDPIETRDSHPIGYY